VGLRKRQGIFNARREADGLTGLIYRTELRKQDIGKADLLVDNGSTPALRSLIHDLLFLPISTIESEVS